MVDDAVVESGGTYVKDSEYLVAVVVPIQTVIVAIVRRNKIGTSCRTCRRRKELPARSVSGHRKILPDIS